MYVGGDDSSANPLLTDTLAIETAAFLMLRFTSIFASPNFDDSAAAPSMYRDKRHCLLQIAMCQILQKSVNVNVETIAKYKRVTFLNQFYRDDHVTVDGQTLICNRISLP